MQQTLLFFHSAIRWLVLISLIVSVSGAYRGYRNHTLFSKRDDLIRHLTATIAHIQLIIGITLYFQSPAVKQFFALSGHAGGITEPLFFGLIHISMMITAILILTIGSAVSKRKKTDREKFKTILIWFGLALLIILAAIPWPFSPLAQRPFIRPI
ncbi:MAG TPA: hypothetical protein VGC08_07830 [Pedobacter sp.]